MRTLKHPACACDGYSDARLTSRTGGLFAAQRPANCGRVAQGSLRSCGQGLPEGPGGLLERFGGWRRRLETLGSIADHVLEIRLGNAAFQNVPDDLAAIRPAAAPGVEGAFLSLLDQVIDRR